MAVSEIPPATLRVPADQVEAIVKRVVEGNDTDLVAVYLFGSVARGEARDDSDVDVAVLFGRRPQTLKDLPNALTAELERCLGWPVEVIPLDDGEPDLIHRVLNEGRLVHERDRSARIRFEVAGRNAYWDLEPHLRRYRRQQGRTQ